MKYVISDMKENGKMIIKMDMENLLTKKDICIKLVS